MTETIIADLKTLHTAAIDARNGYAEALKDAQGQGMTPLFRNMIALHARHADELAAVLRAEGDAADDDGSIMTTVHRTMISIRSLFGGLGQSVLPGLIDGEERNVEHYDDALQDYTLPAATRELLQRQRASLHTAIAGMEGAK